ncbi:hypothetical protein QMG_2007, partial [Clostridioides difficile DA00256]
ELSVREVENIAKKISENKQEEPEKNKTIYSRICRDRIR